MSDSAKYTQKHIQVAQIFNSPVLIPWSVVEPYQKKILSGDEEALEECREKILLWIEAKRVSNRFKENSEVCEMNNPTLQMTIKRIIRETINKGTPDEKKRLVGMECYWWASEEEAKIQIPLMAIRGRRVPSAYPAEDTEDQTGQLQTK